jgi:hypothetical protein
MKTVDPTLISAPSALTWYKHNPVGKDGDDSNKPAPRSCHTMTVVGTNAFLFGGLTNFSPEIELLDDVTSIKGSNEMFRVNLSPKQDIEFTRLPTTSHSNVFPLPRWRHSATLFDGNQIMVFGGFHNTDHRLNDVWIFDTISYSWSQPNARHNAEASIPCQLANTEWTNVPVPRAGHTATLIGKSRSLSFLSAHETFFFLSLLSR